MNARVGFTTLFVQNTKRANELIALGWTLIETASGTDESGYPLTTYSLAWFGDGEPRDY